MNHRTTSISITAFTLLLGASFAWGQTNVSPDLTAALSTSTIAKTSMSSSAASSDSSSSSSTAAVDIIVQYKTAPTNTQYQAVTTLGGTLVTQYGAVTSAQHSVPKSAVQSLAADPNVAYISLNRPVKGMLNITAAAVHSDVANQSGYDGTGIGVAIIDSGI